ncbi:AAA family ATPase [Acetivibrio cellulolyticus]|uniref:AAA family ATPase n=1 Tax=Acetivibrio cellulolyticus TaxID=35830 RepID=UPI0001E30537|nr:AAA family ATPase [Acetivibrio cellulolyticus]
MICINKVLIENFQSHENTELTFHDGLNVIIGPSDHGKSAVIRAIKWVLYNEPRGNEFIRQGSNFARVTLWLNTGYTITRERTPSKNRYILSDNDGNSNVYEGFGNEVPHEVIKAHGIPKVMLDTDINSSINMGGQLEGPFLISESGSVRAKAIGRLTGLHIIDKSIRDSATDLRRENQTRDRINDELVSVDEKLNEFRYLDLLEDRIEVSSNHIKRIEEYLDRISTLTSINGSLLDINQMYSKAAYELTRLEKLDECEMLLKKVEIGYMRLRSMDNLRNRYKDNSFASTEMSNILANTDKVNDGISLLKQINEKTNRYESLIKANRILEEIGNELVKATDIIDSTKNIVKSDVLVSQIGENIIRMIRLIAIKEKLVDYDQEIMKVHNLLKKSVDLVESNDIISSINNKRELCARLESLRSKYDPIVHNIIEGNNYLNSNKEDIEKYLKAYVDLLKENGKCPLCNSKISEDKLGDIIKQYEEVH